MAKRRITEESSEVLDTAEESTAETAVTTEAIVETLSETPAIENGEDTPVKKDTSPALIELKTGGLDDPALGQVSKEQIEASIKEKLSRKTDSAESDPFVPNVQLENEVKEVAKNKGFPLSRGTEIGARLLARSQRIKK